MRPLSDWFKNPHLSKTLKFSWTGHDEERERNKENRRKWAEEEAKEKK